MIIYQGIQLVYAHVVQLITSIGNWFQGIDFSVVTGVMPLQYQAPIAACITIMLAMSAIGLVKKLSFLLG